MVPDRPPGKLTHDDEHFLLDGKPHQIISGSMTYFRLLPEQWSDRLAKLAAMGCNAVETYVPWNLHEPRPGQFDFSGRLDLERYLERAAGAGLHVLFRPGPFICGEWEAGGLPWWLFKERDMVVRCSHPAFLEHLDRWWDALLPRVAPYLSTNGGPVVACQVENEYGYYGDDTAYLEHLRDRLSTLGVLLFTSDGAGPMLQAHGGLPDVLRTANFVSEPEKNFAMLRAAQPKGPLACMEFWVGWFDAWGNRGKSRREIREVTDDLSWILGHGAGVNFFVFCGGTSFGFTSGANLYEEFEPDVTSYDYDGLLTECGDVTPKYLACREAIARHTGRTDLTTTFPPSPKLALGEAPLTESASLEDALPALGSPVRTLSPRPIEQLDEGYGYVLYRTRLPASYRGRRLHLAGMHDFAHVLVDGAGIGTWYRNDEQPEWRVEFEGDGARLDILVDCMARPNFGHRIGEGKGITEGVFFGEGRHDLNAHFGWTCHALPMADLGGIAWSAETPTDGPRFYRAQVDIEEPADTFLELPGFTKGFAMVNGFNLGRFWNIGPQYTLYIPAPLVRQGSNELIVFDVVGCEAPVVRLLDEPVWAGG